MCFWHQAVTEGLLTESCAAGSSAFHNTLRSLKQVLDKSEEAGSFCKCYKGLLGVTDMPSDLGICCILSATLLSVTTDRRPRRVNKVDTALTDDLLRLFACGRQRMGSCMQLLDRPSRAAHTMSLASQKRQLEPCYHAPAWAGTSPKGQRQGTFNVRHTYCLRLTCASTSSTGRQKQSSLLASLLIAYYLHLSLM